MRRPDALIRFPILKIINPYAYAVTFDANTLMTYATSKEAALSRSPVRNRR